MTTSDIWVSGDCQAYVIGEDWYPTVELSTGRVDAYQWYQKVYGAPLLSGDPVMTNWDNAGYAQYSEALQKTDYKKPPVYDGKRTECVDTWCWPWYEMAMFPDVYAPADAFAQAVFAEVSPECAAQLPKWEDFDDIESWQRAYDDWAQKYPAMQEMLGHIRELGISGEMPIGENLRARRKKGEPRFTPYVGSRNLKNASADSYGLFFGDEGN
jgi:hypothetical protein